MDGHLLTTAPSSDHVVNVTQPDAANIQRVVELLATPTHDTDHFTVSNIHRHLRVTAVYYYTKV